MRGKLLWVLLSVALLAAGWLRVSGAALLVALVPLLMMSGRYGASRGDFWRMAGWVSLTMGLWAVATVWWIWNAAAVGAIAAVVIQILLFGGVFMLYHYVSKRARRPLAYVVLVAGWIAAEYLYLTGKVSFPWLQLGGGLAGDVWAVQWYEFTGVFGGSLWVLVSNLLVWQAIASGRRKWWLREALWVLVPVAVSLIMFHSYDAPADGRTARVTLVQPNLEPYTEKFFMPQTEQDSILLSLAGQAPADVDYIVMPETAIDNNIWEHDVQASPSIARFAEFARSHYPAAQVVVGATTFKLYADEEQATETARQSNGGYWYDIFNSALAITPAGVGDIHHKAKLVVGTEAMPYMNILKPLAGFIVDLGGTTGQLGIDDNIRVFALPRQGDTIRAAAPICYESVYGEHFASFTAGGAQLMFVVTNDGWWGDTPGYRQHFAFSRLRAIETRRWVGRSANTGISGFIDPRGGVHETLGWDLRGALTADVALSDKVTFYARHGDYIGRVCCYIFILAILYYVAYRYRRRSLLTE